jgi:hypothetical protein
LGTIVVLLVSAALAYLIFASDTDTGRAQAAESIWGFVTNIAPPIVTLVLGFYFGAQRVGTNNDN